jgi:hypothetical protein
MKILSGIAISILATVSLVAWLFLAPSVTLGEGGEPHNCEGFNAYDPPPFMGYVTITFQEYCTIGEQLKSGCAFLSGTVERAGTGETYVLDGLVYETGIEYESQFLTHTAQDVRGRCIEAAVMGEPQWGNFEIIAAHGLEYDSGGYSFNVYIIAMPLTNR